MFTSLKAQHINNDGQAISPVTNIDSVYYELMTIENGEISVERHAVGKNMAILHVVSETIEDVKCKSSSYETDDSNEMLLQSLEYKLEEIHCQSLIKSETPDNLVFDDKSVAYSATIDDVNLYKIENTTQYSVDTILAEYATKLYSIDTANACDASTNESLNEYNSKIQNFVKIRDRLLKDSAQYSLGLVDLSTVIYFRELLMQFAGRASLHQFKKYNMLYCPNDGSSTDFDCFPFVIEVTSKNNKEFFKTSNAAKHIPYNEVHNNQGFVNLKDSVIMCLRIINTSGAVSETVKALYLGLTGFGDFAYCGKYGLLKIANDNTNTKVYKLPDTTMYDEEPITLSCISTMFNNGQEEIGKIKLMGSTSTSTLLSALNAATINVAGYSYLQDYKLRVKNDNTPQFPAIKLQYGGMQQMTQIEKFVIDYDITTNTITYMRDAYGNVATFDFYNKLVTIDDCLEYPVVVPVYNCIETNLFAVYYVNQTSTLLIQDIMKFVTTHGDMSIYNYDGHDNKFRTTDISKYDGQQIVNYPFCANNNLTNSKNIAMSITNFDIHKSLLTVDKYIKANGLYNNNIINSSAVFICTSSKNVIMNSHDIVVYNNPVSNFSLALGEMRILNSNNFLLADCYNVNITNCNGVIGNDSTKMANASNVKLNNCTTDGSNANVLSNLEHSYISNAVIKRDNASVDAARNNKNHVMIFDDSVRAFYEYYNYVGDSNDTYVTYTMPMRIYQAKDNGITIRALDFCRL